MKKTAQIIDFRTLVKAMQAKENELDIIVTLDEDEPDAA